MRAPAPTASGLITATGANPNTQCAARREIPNRASEIARHFVRNASVRLVSQHLAQRGTPARRYGRRQESLFGAPIPRECVFSARVGNATVLDRVHQRL